MRKRIPVVTPMKVVAFVVYVASVAICSLTTGCSTFFFTKTYHKAATERSVFTPIRVATVAEARLDPDGMLTVAFSGWNCCRNMEAGTERNYVVHVQTIPSSDSPGASDIQHSPKRGGTIRVVTLDKTDIEPPESTTTAAVPVPVHIFPVDKLRRTRWDVFASTQVGPGVWLRPDSLTFLYIPAPETVGTIPMVLAQSSGEYARTFPLLLYGYPVAVPALAAVDVLTLPIKAVAVVFFFVTWDGSMF